MANMALLLLVLLVISRADGLVDFTYTADPVLSGQIPSVASPLYVRSMFDCAAVCSSDTDCQGFYYSRTGQGCFPDTNTFTSFEVDTNAVYLTKGDVEVSRRLVSNTLCPSTFHENIRLLGVSGNYYLFTMSRNNVNQSEAVTACTNKGLHLIKVNNDTKILDLVAFLNACSAYSQYRYWTDAMRQANEFGQPWRNSDGTEANLTNLWCSSDGGGSCLRFRTGCGFWLNDFHCDRTAAFICE